MKSNGGKRAKEPGVRNRRYSIRYPFAADVEMLELKSGSCMNGVTSDLSLGGCFVCALHPRGWRPRPRSAHPRRPASKDAGSGACGETAVGEGPRISGH